MSKTPFKVLKLRSGDDVIAKLIKNTKDMIRLDRPMILKVMHYVDSMNGSKRETIVLYDWMKMTTSNHIDMPRDHVLGIFDANPDIVTQVDGFDHLCEDRALMLSWPYSEEYGKKDGGTAPWDAEILKKYQGSHVIYIGDWPSKGVGMVAPECCSQKFLDVLEKDWRVVEHVVLPHWPQSPNDLFVLERQ